MASLLSKLRNLFLPAPDVNVAFDFGRNVAHESLALYRLIDKDKAASRMSKRDKYRLIAVIKNYRFQYGTKPKTGRLIDIWMRRIEVRTTEDAFASVALIALDDNLQVFE